MSDIYAKRSQSQYVVVDFDNVTEKGLSTLIKALASSGAKVASVEANNRKTKKDGIYVKRARLNFENQQNIVLFIGEHGDIFQMTLNGKKHPVPNVSNERDLSKEIAQTLKSTQAAFDKSALKKLNRKPRDPAAEKPLSSSLANKIQQSQAQLAEITEQQKTVETMLSETQGNHAAVTQEIERLKIVLETEFAETKQLEQEIYAKKAGK